MHEDAHNSRESSTVVGALSALAHERRKAKVWESGRGSIS